MKTCYNAIDIVFNILKKKKKRNCDQLAIELICLPDQRPFLSESRLIRTWQTLMIQVPDEAHAQLHTDARNAIGRIRMHAQRDIHMAECLVHGNVALCTECISVIAIRHWAVARQYGTWIRIQNRIFCIHTLCFSLSLSSFFLFFPPTNVSFSVLGRDLVSRRPSVKFCRVRFWGFSIHRVTEPLKTLVYRFVDRKMFDQPRRSDSWKREIKWNSLFVREITSTVKYLSFSGWRETWRIF